MWWTTRCVAGILFANLAAIACSMASPIELSPRADRDEVVRVTMELQAGGDTQVQRETDDKGSVGPEQRLPTKATAKLTYAERRLGSPPSPPNGRKALALRYYESIEASIQVGERSLEPKLADNHRLIVVEMGAARPLLYCPGSPLTREELDLVDTIGNTAVIDRLLPTTPVEDGATWPVDATAIAAVLTLDSVAVGEVRCVLEEYNGSYAKVRLAGVVHGTVDGAATQQDVRGVYLVDRELRRITRLNLAVREQRSIGTATPGLDAIAKVQMTIEAADEVLQLTDSSVDELTLPQETPTTDLAYDAPAMGFRLHCDRNWFVTSQQRESITLRRIDGSELVSQCTLAVLPAKSADHQTSLEQFQRDIKYSLGASFGQVMSSRQWQNAEGHYCYEVISRGTAEQVPVEWHHYLVARDGGHRIAATTTIESSRVTQSAESDRILIERLQLYPPLPAATARASEAIAK